MARADQYNLLGKTISRDYILKLLKKGYLVKDIVREWAKDNNIKIFGGTRASIPKDRTLIRSAVNKLIYGFTRAPYKNKAGELVRHVGRPADKVLVDLVKKNKASAEPANVSKQFDKFIKNNKAAYVGKAGGTEKLYDAAIQWFKKNNPAALNVVGEATDAARAGVTVKPGQEVIMIKKGMNSTVASFQGGRESIKELVSLPRKLKSPTSYERQHKTWAEAAKSLGMTSNQYTGMIRNNMINPLKKLFPQLIGTQYAPGAEHMYGLRQALATGLMKEIKKAAKNISPAPAAFNRGIKGPLLDKRVSGLMDNAFNTQNLGKRRDIIKTINRTIGDFKKEYPGKYPKYTVDQVGNIKDLTFKNINLTKRSLNVQATEFIDYLNKTPGFKESAEFKSFPEATKTLFQSRAERSPQFYSQLVKSINSVPALKSIMEKRVGCAEGCLAQVAKNEPGKFGKALETLPQKAKGFLGILGRGGMKAAPYAALAAVGAAAEPLVKQFVADDPNTYLTNENQMKGMLIATLEGEPPKVDEEILKWQTPALAGATAAGAIPGAAEVYRTRQGIPPNKFVGPMQKGVGPLRAGLGIKGVLGKALGASFSPLTVAATLPISVAAQRAGGTDYSDIATDPMNWMGPAFASTGAEMASKGIKSPVLLKALRMGMSPRTLSLVSRRFGLPGLAISAGMWGYDKWKNRDEE